MNCADAEELLLELAEDTLEPDAARRVQAHLKRCAACRLKFDDLRRVAAELRGLGSAFAQPAARESPRPSASGAWPAGSHLGDFEIISELGRGGMGIVYRARQISLNRPVALKVLSTPVVITEGMAARFRTEAQAAAKLDHPNVVRVFAQGEAEGRLFYAMELVEGQSLAATVREDARSAEWPGASRNLRSLAACLADLADALAAAHAAGVVHRDIKPHNILVARPASPGAPPTLKIADFGLARLFEEPGVTLSGEIIGTPAYMSPEQVSADRHAIDHRTDIFSFGVMLYEVLTGRRPFEGATRDQIVARICHAEPVPPRRLSPTVPIDLETICLKALEKDPGRRYQSATDLADDLRRFAALQPIRARRAGSMERLGKWVRRRPAATLLIAAGVSVACLATLLVLQSVKARRGAAARLVVQAFDLLSYEDYRDPARAMQYLDEAERLGPPDRATFAAARGLAALRRDPREAVRLLREAVGLRPNDTELLYLLAWALFRNDQFIEQRQWLDRAAALGGPTTARGYFFRAQALVRAEPERATEDYREAIKLRSGYLQAMIHLCRADNQWMYHHRSHERWDEQATFLKTACGLSEKAYPRYLRSIAYRLSAEIHAAAGRTAQAEIDYAEALASARDAQAREPGSPRGYAAEAEYWESRRDYDKAIAAWNRGFPYATGADRSEFYEYRWRLLYWTGQTEAALADLSELASICPTDSPRWAWFAVIFPALLEAERGDAEAAAARIRAVANTRPRDSVLLLSAACGLRLLGRIDAASRLLTERFDHLEFESGALPQVSKAWLEAVTAYTAGQITRAELESRAGPKKTDRWLWACVYFMEACDALGTGMRDDAVRGFEMSRECFDDETFTYLASVLLPRLRADPGWPPWLNSATLRNSGGVGRIMR